MAAYKLYELPGTCIVFLLFSIMAFSPAASAKDVIGWVENIRIYPGFTLVKAKIDTGAVSSSIHCDFVKPVERNGEQWVKFTVSDINGKTVTIEKKYCALSK